MSSEEAYREEKQMKAILEFNLPEEREEFNLALNGHKAQIIIDEIFSELRKNLKYGRTTQFQGLQVTDEQLYEVLENVRELIVSIQADYE